MVNEVYMLYILIFFGVIILDQLTKAIVDMNNYHVTIIKNVFSITNTRNSGAAFGMMSDQPEAQILFAVLTISAMIAIGAYLIIRKEDVKWLTISLSFIASGAIGNFIDRLAFKEVRDFIYVHFFANFNVADIAVTIGGIMFVIYFCFLDKDAIFKKPKKKEALDEGN